MPELLSYPVYKLEGEGFKESGSVDIVKTDSPFHFRKCYLSNCFIPTLFPVCVVYVEIMMVSRRMICETHRGTSSTVQAGLLRGARSNVTGLLLVTLMKWLVLTALLGKLIMHY